MLICILEHNLGFDDIGCNQQYRNQIGSPIPEDDSVCWEIERFGFTEETYSIPTLEPTLTRKPTTPPVVTPDTGAPTDSASPTFLRTTQKPTVTTSNVSFVETSVACIWCAEPFAIASRRRGLSLPLQRRDLSLPLHLRRRGLSLPLRQTKKTPKRAACEVSFADEDMTAGVRKSHLSVWMKSMRCAAAGTAQMEIVPMRGNLDAKILIPVREAVVPNPPWLV